MARIITNKHNLPQSLVDAVKYDTHRTAGDISMTQLIDAPQVRMLRKMAKDISEDVSDMMWALLGTAVHAVLERAQVKNVMRRSFLIVLAKIKQEAEWAAGIDNDYCTKMNKLAENIRFYMDQWCPETNDRYIFEETMSHTIDGMTISGTYDLYDKEERKLQDYKLCSVWSYIYPESRKKWQAQTNGYAWMLRERGMPVDKIEVVAIFRDWSRAKTYEADYPPRQTMTIDIPVIKHDLMTKQMKAWVAKHQAAEAGNVPPCNAVDRWAKADEYAVKSVSHKRALALTPTMEAADKWIADNQQRFDPKLFVEQRIGQNKRCESFCSVSDICPQYKSILDNNSVIQYKPVTG